MKLTALWLFYPVGCVGMIMNGVFCLFMSVKLSLAMAGRSVYGLDNHIAPVVGREVSGRK